MSIKEIHLDIYTKERGCTVVIAEFGEYNAVAKFDDVDTAFDTFKFSGKILKETESGNFPQGVITCKGRGDYVLIVDFDDESEKILHIDKQNDCYQASTFIEKFIEIINACLESNEVGEE